MGNQVTKSIIVNGTVPQIYDLWSDFENFPHFMKHIKSVSVTGDGNSHWVMEGPLGTTLEWDAKTTLVEENKRIGWNSKGQEGDLTTSGQVTFNGLPNNQTEVTVTMQYDPPAGLAGEVVDRLFATPEERLTEDLRNFKAFAEGRFERLNR